jgi:alanine dehydrogenase
VRITIPRESKQGEGRVGQGVEGVASLVGDGHEVRVESGAGARIGIRDEDFRTAGARIVDPGGTWEGELVVKVKEIQPGEWERIQPGQTIFGYQQLVGAPELTRAIAARGATAIAYEMVRDAAGRFPLLAPMSRVSGELAVIQGAYWLARPGVGNGTLLSGPAAQVLILGAGNAGLAAARVASALGARVAVLTRSGLSVEAARRELGTAIEADLATPAAVERHALAADLVVGAALVPGKPTPKLLSRALVARMKRGAVLVDISIDGGGVAETSRPTTHADPAYVEEGVVHLCIPNLPAAVAPASSAALSASSLPFVRELAAKGIARAVREDAALRAGVLIWRGRVNHAGIAAEAGLPYSGLSDPDLA